MATSPGTIDELLDLLAPAGRLSSRKMFGEYCLYLADRPVAFVCDDTLFVKITDAGREIVPDAAEGPCYPGSKAYFRFPPETWSDRDTLCKLLRVTFEHMPAPKPKPKRKSPPKPRRKRGDPT